MGNEGRGSEGEVGIIIMNEGGVRGKGSCVRGSVG